MSRLKSFIAIAAISGLSLVFQACANEAPEAASDSDTSSEAPAAVKSVVADGNSLIADIVDGATVIHTANFTGESDHVVSGTVKILQKGENYYVKLAEDFSFDGAPDPRLGFSKADTFAQESLFSSLNLDSGKQLYRLPATLDVSNFDEVTIWCKKFEVPLAEAKW